MTDEIQEIETLRKIAQIGEQSIITLKEEQATLKSEVVQLKNVIRAMVRFDGHLSMDCKLWGCTWACRRAKELIPDLKAPAPSMPQRPA